MIMVLNALKTRSGRVVPKVYAEPKKKTVKDVIDELNHVTEQDRKVKKTTTKPAKNKEQEQPKRKKITARKEQHVEQFEVVGKVGSFKKSDTITIMAEINEYKDQVRLDIREYQISENYTGPTKRGINIETECFMDLFRLMEEVKNRLDEAGLLQE